MNYCKEAFQAYIVVFYYFELEIFYDAITSLLLFNLIEQA